MENGTQNHSNTQTTIADRIAEAWSETKTSFAFLTFNTEEFADYFITKVKKVFTEVFPEERIAVCREVLKIICRTKEYKVKIERNKYILFGLLHLLGDFQTSCRKVIRDILTILFIYSGHINREIFLFDREDRFTQCNKRRQVFMFQQVTGWRLPSKEPWTQCPSSDYYIDLPLRRSDNEANTQLMTEAIYHQRDPGLFLLLLQSGAVPSCLYLLPVCIILDFKLSLLDTMSDDPSYVSEESKIIRYFCRNRHYIQVHIVNRDRNVFMANLPPNLSFDDVLLMSPISISLIPPERYKTASSLMHQSRLAVRKALLQADCLPHGIPVLGLPKTLEKYLNLEDD